MRPDKHRLGSVGVLIATGCLISLTWAGTLRAIEAQRIEASARVTATITNQAITFAEQINRQVLALDQSLRIVGDMWAMNPGGFDLESWRDRSVVLSGISRDMLLMDQNGIVRQSTVPEAVNQDLSSRDFFRDPAAHPVAGGGSFVSGTTIGPILRQWHMNVARPLLRTDGTFGGVIDADYRISALTDVFSQTDIGSHGLIALVGLNDGKLRAAVGPATIDPDARITDTPMFHALRRDPNAVWVGSSPSDATTRIHAFRRLPDRDLAIVVAADEQEAMRPATVWAYQAKTFAACITALLIAMAGLLLRARRVAKKRVAALAEGQAVLAAANAQLEVARAEATAKTEQLEVTLAGMADGVSMLDAHLCLVEWNARFPEIAGIPGDILRVGQPMEQILRAQAIAGQFGDVDVETEIDRRMTILRSGRAGTTERTTPDGRFLQLRRNRLPDGGFVTLYSDITEHKLTEQALREARAAADTANAAKSRFVAIVSHEIRTPLNALLNTMRLLADSDLAAPQRSLVDMARQSGDALYGLINDILEMSRMEAGQLTLRPSRFALRPVLTSATDMFQAQAQQRGIGFRIDIADDVPEELLTDPGRVRQILLNLLSNAVKFSAPGTVLLKADKARSALSDTEVLRISVRDGGPAISAEDRKRLFRPFTRLARPEGEDLIGTGLGLSICRHLATLMAGEIGCDTWLADHGLAGNDFWIELPLPPAEAGEDAAAGAGWSQTTDAAMNETPEHRRRLPRTRVLLVEDIRANQVVTASLLRREGHMVDIVSSGEAAVRAATVTPYDVIFMDIFMPGMGGQEATRRIRALRGAAAATPIIALTANVSPEDEELFKASAMDGILAKPVSLTDLLDALARLVWRKGQADAQFRQLPPGQDGTGDSCILAADRVQELRSNLAPATLAALVDECLTDLDHRLPALRRALTAGVPASITAHAHAMVGMAAGYGLAALEARLRVVMNAARDGDAAALGATAAAAIEAELGRSAVALRGALQQELA